MERQSTEPTPFSVVKEPTAVNGKKLTVEQILSVTRAFVEAKAFPLLQIALDAQNVKAPADLKDLAAQKTFLLKLAELSAQLPNASRTQTVIKELLNNGN